MICSFACQVSNHEQERSTQPAMRDFTIDSSRYQTNPIAVRTEIGLALGGGYGSDTTGYTDPTAFIRMRQK